METIRTTTVLLVVALAFAGCAQSPTAERVEPSTAPPVTQPEPVEQPTEITNPYGLTDAEVEVLFLANVHQLAPETLGVPDTDLIVTAFSICDAFDTGVSFDLVALTAIGSGLSTETGGVLIGSAVAAYCDEYLDLIG